jgi:pimeloyl-ACP methyl ester carboxylesterase
MGLMTNRIPMLLKALIVLAVLYLALCLAGCLAYRSVLYPAPRDAAPDPPPGASLRSIRASDGVVVPALHFPAPSGAPTVVHFHGNGETLRTETPFALALVRRGLGVFLVEYRGYGAAPGDPGEEELYRDAEAALATLSEGGVRREDIVLSGISLGTGVAAEMAARGHGARLVLVAPYTSIPRLAGRLVPFLPTSIIVADRFDTLEKAAKIRVPTLVIHGDQDELIPHEMGKSVAAAIAGARLVTVEGGHHNDLFAVRPDLLDAIAEHAKGR